MKLATASLRRTPFYPAEVAAGAKVIEFAGWEMPVYFSGILEEYRAVRTSAGLFDIGHMGAIKISGPGALSLVQLATTNDASGLAVGQAQYSIIANEKGGVRDDVLVYRLPEYYLIINNAVNVEKILKHLADLAASLAAAGGREPASVIDLKDRWTLLSLQGPKSELILESICDINLSALRYYHAEFGQVLGIPALISRTGYTGEDGFELFFDRNRAAEIWERLLAEGAKPCGLGARDILRQEAGMPLYGHEHTEDSTPLEAGVGGTVKFDKGNFIGREALLKQKEAGLSRVLVGLATEEKIIPRQGCRILNPAGGEPIGAVTSGTMSPALAKSIAMGYVNCDYRDPGRMVLIEVRGKSVPAKVTALPFYRRKKKEEIS